nr:MAG TPA: hypothetical protein [Caudoviricetes sp.]
MHFHAIQCKEMKNMILIDMSGLSRSVQMSLTVG